MGKHAAIMFGAGPNQSRPALKFLIGVAAPSPSLSRDGFTGSGHCVEEGVSFAVFLSVLLSITLPRSVFLRDRALSRSPEHALRVEQIVSDHADAVWRTARRLGIPTRDIEDVAQEVMLVVFRRVGDIEHARERAFVLGTTARVCANWRRSLRRHPEDPSEGVEELPGAASALSSAPADGERALEHSEKLALLDGALCEMNEQQRTSFVMFELEQMTAGEIARELGTSEASVVSRVRRAREVLWRHCHRIGFAAPPQRGSHE
jgi:RNA polymerase sigma-70 factor (ECF subfamily)